MKSRTLRVLGMILAVYAVLVVLYYTTGITLFIQIVQSMNQSFPVLLIVAMGGLISERSGVTNIALEGIMLMGAFLGFWFIINMEQAEINTFTTLVLGLISIIIALALVFGVLIIINILLDRQKKQPLKLKLWIKLVISLVIGVGLTLLFLSIPINKQMLFILALVLVAAMGGLYSMIHAYAAVYLKSNQIISATALNLFAPAFSIFTLRLIRGGSNIDVRTNFRINEIPILSDIPVIGDMFFTQNYLSFFLAIAVFIIVTIFLYKTRFGLRLRACGENPHAADSLGVNIYKTRFIAVTLSGVLAGMGGLMYVIPTKTYGTTVEGFGFLAIAVLIFGNWKPKGIIFAALFFSFMKTLALYYTEVDFLARLDLSSEIYNAIPFITTLVVLAFFSKKSSVPKALGQIYDQGKR